MNQTIIRSSKPAEVSLGTTAIVNDTGLIHSRFTRPTISISPAAEEQQHGLILGLAGVVAVTNPKELESATGAGVAARKFCKAVEECRVQTTRPLREFTDQVSALAKELIAPVEAEMARVGKQIALYRQQEEERVRKEEAKRNEEIRLAALAATEAERARVAAEQTMLTEDDLARALKVEDEAKAKEEAFRAVVTTTPPSVTRAAGSAVRKEIRFEIVDIHAIYAARPELVNLELNKAACRSILNAQSVVTGLRITG
jgi:hypothetical protein